MWETTPLVAAVSPLAARDATALDLQFQRGRGDSVFNSSRIWFTLSHGILNEIYYPTIDRPQTRDMEFLITDGETFFHEEKRDLDEHDFLHSGTYARLSHRERGSRRPLSAYKRDNSGSSSAVRAPACAHGSGC